MFKMFIKRVNKLLKEYNVIIWGLYMFALGYLGGLGLGLVSVTISVVMFVVSYIVAGLDPDW